MKKLLCSVTAFLLLIATLILCACGGGGGGITPPDGSDGSSTPGGDDPADSITVYDPTLPMDDPAAALMSYLYPNDTLLAQPVENVFEGSSTNRNDIVKDFAKAEQIIARGRPETPLYGIYTFTHEYMDNQDTVVKAGFTCVRMGDNQGAWSDDQTMLTIAENGLNVMAPCGIASLFNKNNPQKSYFLPERYGVPNCKTNELMSDINNYDLAGWLNDSIELTLNKIEVFGPRGSFWDKYPDANYNPIRYYEFFNEPNYQYLIPVTRDDGSDDPYNKIKYQVYAILQTCMYNAIKPIYDDEIYFVGMSAGGGAGEQGQKFIEDIFKYNHDTTVISYLNRTLNLSSDETTTLVRYYSETEEEFETRKAALPREEGESDEDYLARQNALVRYGESDDDYAARQASAAALRTSMGLAEGAAAEIDLINTMDIMSIHPYADGSSPFAAFQKSGLSQAFYIKKMRDAMTANSKAEDYERALNMSIWFTECGWEIKGHNAYKEAYPEDYANGIYGGQADHSENGTSQMLQAAMEVQDYLWGIRNGIDFISYMHMYDTDKCNYGLVNYGYDHAGKNDHNASGCNNKSPRLTIYAIATMTKMLPNPALWRVIQEGKVDSTDDYLFIYEIESDIGGEIVTTVFSPLNATEAQVAWEDDYALVTDMFGKAMIVKASGGFVTLTAGPYMQYISHVDDAMLEEHGLIVTVEFSDAIAMLGMAWTTSDEDIL